MKKHTIHLSKFISGKFFFVLLAALLATGVSANAQTVVAEKPVSEAVVKHQGSIGDKEYFSVKYANESGEKFSIKVKDADGIIIFQDIFLAKNFEKSFEFDKLIDKSKLTFFIRSFKDNVDQVFVVNSKVFTVEQVEITKEK